MVFLISVPMVDMEVVPAASCVAAHGELFAEYAVTVLVLYTTVLMEAHMATLALVRCGAKVVTAGTSS
jgi:hypothetical protein